MLLVNGHSTNFMARETSVCLLKYAMQLRWRSHNYIAKQAGLEANLFYLKKEGKTSHQCWVY